jgi:hypothetical protein
MDTSFRDIRLTNERITHYLDSSGTEKYIEGIRLKNLGRLGNNYRK